MSPWNLGGYAIAAAMVVVCARLHLDREAFSGVVQLAGTMVGGVAGVAVAAKVASRAASGKAAVPNETLDGDSGSGSNR